MPLPGLRAQPLMTTTVAWVLETCLLTPMFDDVFMLKTAFVVDGRHLRRRLHIAGIAAALLSPFVVLFLLCLLYTSPSPRD